MDTENSKRLAILRSYGTGTTTEADFLAVRWKGYDEPAYLIRQVFGGVPEPQHRGYIPDGATRIALYSIAGPGVMLGVGRHRLFRMARGVPDAEQ